MYRLSDEAGGSHPDLVLLRLPCPVCRVPTAIGVAKAGRGKALRVVVHGPRGDRCPGSRRVFPEADCPSCDGSGRQECSTPWCTQPDEHAGDCPACWGTGIAVPWLAM